MSQEVRTEHGKFVINWILHNVPNGARLRWPSVLGSEPKLHCRKKLMRLVESCWHVDPRKRPTMEVRAKTMISIILCGGARGFILSCICFAHGEASAARHLR